MRKICTIGTSESDEINKSLVVNSMIEKLNYILSEKRKRYEYENR